MKLALGAASVQLPLAIDDRSSLLWESEREGTQSEWTSVSFLWFYRKMFTDTFASSLKPPFSLRKEALYQCECDLTVKVICRVLFALLLMFLLRPCIVL